MAKIFWSSIFILFVLIVISGFYLYQYFSTNREIVLSLQAPQKIMVGEPFDLIVNFNNDSKNVLKDVKLSIFLPDGASAVSHDKDKRVITKSIGELGSNSSFQEKISLAIFGGTQTVKNFNVSVSYGSTLSARFEKNQSIEIDVGESAILLDLTAPEKVLNNEEFELAINYTNISETDFSAVRLTLIYPSNFILKESKPKISDSALEIGDLAKKGSGTVSLKGKIIGPEQSFFEIKTQIQANYSGESYLISEKSAQVSIAVSPLSLGIVLDSRERDFVLAGDSLRYRLTYQNNTETGLIDIVIKAQLIGEMFDFSTLKTIGAFNSRDNTLVWNASTIPDLKFLAAKSSGFAEFEIKLKENYPIKKLSDKNFVLKIKGEISSPTVPDYVAAEKTIGLNSLETKVGGKTAIESSVYLSKGALPPKVNQPISFVIYWTIRNYATDVKDVLVKAYLQPGVKFTGVIKNNIAEVPVYNERTGEITWSIPKILAAKGIVGKPIEAVFQIELVPNITQIAKEAPLLSETSITAVDEFVNAPLSGFSPALTTKSLKDSGFNPQMGEVIP